MGTILSRLMVILSAVYPDIVKFVSRENFAIGVPTKILGLILSVYIR